MRILIRIAFLGREFYGTQKQPNKNTLQGLFESLLSRIYATHVKVTIGSRLDRGVHAHDFALTFDTDDQRQSLDHLAYYLRRSLPLDVRLLDIRKVSSSFHPRYDCRFKSYVYFLQNGEDYNPLWTGLSSVLEKPIDLSRFKEAVCRLEGLHDFGLLSSPEEGEKTVLWLEKSEVIEEGNRIYVRFVSKAFLRYQVRFMVGMAIQYAYGKLTMEDVSSILDGKEIAYPKFKAEPNGLFLEKICYPDLGDDASIPQGKPDFLLP